MGRQLTAKELKRFGRVLAGHSQDKDRERWKRKVKGEAKPQPQRRITAPDEEPLDEATDAEAEPR